MHLLEHWCSFLRLCFNGDHDKVTSPSFCFCSAANLCFAIAFSNSLLFSSTLIPLISKTITTTTINVILIFLNNYNHHTLHHMDYRSDWYHPPFWVINTIILMFKGKTHSVLVRSWKLMLVTWFNKTKHRAICSHLEILKNKLFILDSSRWTKVFPQAVPRESAVKNVWRILRLNVAEPTCQPSLHHKPQWETIGLFKL